MVYFKNMFFSEKQPISLLMSNIFQV